MAPRTIVTFHPDVACDMCGRRLLRGEQPDVFLSGGQRRMVCELCTPRATHEGWRRETDERTVSARSERPQRGLSLLGRLRQLREPARATDRRTASAERAEARRQAPGSGDEAPALGEEWSSIDDEWAGASGSWAAADGGIDGAEQSGEADGRTAAEQNGGEERLALPVDPRSTADAASMRRALEVFNAGEQPRRMAGVARALGAPCVRATYRVDETVAIVVAWELSWYRFEIDLGDEAAGAQLVARGTELEELPAQERIANAVADERGELSLLQG